jgi:hypothetical protein
VSNNTSTAARYREFAQGCKSLAHTAHSSEHRAALLRMRDEWLRIAEELEQIAAKQTGAAPGAVSPQLHKVD